MAKKRYIKYKIDFAENAKKSGFSQSEIDLALGLNQDDANEEPNAYTVNELPRPKGARFL